MPIELGARIGDYQFIDVLESNREETTYRVRNVPAQRFETLRVLNVSPHQDRLRVERFQREAKILARLKHPHIVGYCSSLKLDDKLALATELVEGSSLAERLEVGPVSLPDAVRIIWQTLEALECAHGEGVIHRDITPQRIFLTYEGEVKLGGFFLARSTADPRLTQVGAAIGSAHYMSPEQVQANGELDPRSDLYSLGVVFYELVTRRKPIDGESQFDVMLAHVENQPLPPTHWNRALGEEMDQLILRALAKNPADRFQSAAEFREALMSVNLGSTGEAKADLESALERQKRLLREEQERAERRAREMREGVNPAMVSALAANLDQVPAAAPAGSNLSGPVRVMLLVAITAAACAIYFWMFVLR
jgi:serine/threonine-protein kinase